MRNFARQKPMQTLYQVKPTIIKSKISVVSCLLQKNEERVEERDKALREKNVIILGVEESNAENDTTFVKTLFATVGCDGIKPKSTARIGMEHKDKRRPIKVSLNHENETLQVMNNLTKLKGRDAYRRISITEDYTVSERKMIQEMRYHVNLKKKTNQKLLSLYIDCRERSKRIADKKIQEATGRSSTIARPADIQDVG